MARIVCFDVETTGLNPNEEHIIEFGAVVVDETGKELSSYNELIKTRLIIPDEAYRVHGISKQMLNEYGKRWDSIAGEVYELVQGADYWCGQNLDFDIRFVRAALQREDIELLDCAYVDTLKSCRRFIPGLKNYRLKTLCDHLGVSLDNAHRAVHDARATVQLAFKLCERLNLGFDQIAKDDVVCLGEFAIGLDPFEAQVLGLRR